MTSSRPITADPSSGLPASRPRPTTSSSMREKPRRSSHGDNASMRVRREKNQQARESLTKATPSPLINKPQDHNINIASPNRSTGPLLSPAGVRSIPVAPPSSIPRKTEGIQPRSEIPRLKHKSRVSIKLSFLDKLFNFIIINQMLRYLDYRQITVRLVCIDAIRMFTVKGVPLMDQHHLQLKTKSKYFSCQIYILK